MHENLARKTPQLNVSKDVRPDSGARQREVAAPVQNELEVASLPSIPKIEEEKSIKGRGSLVSTLRYKGRAFSESIGQQRFAFKTALGLLTSVSPSLARERIGFAIADGCKAIPTGLLVGFLLDKAGEIAGAGSAAVVGAIGTVAVWFASNLLFGVLSEADQRNRALQMIALEANADKEISESTQRNYHQTLNPDYTLKIQTLRERLGTVFGAPGVALGLISGCSSIVGASFVMWQAPREIWGLAIVAALTPGAISYLAARAWLAHEHAIAHVRRSYWFKSYFGSNAKAAQQLRALNGQKLMQEEAQKELKKVSSGARKIAQIKWIGALVDRPVASICGALAIGYMLRECACGRASVGQVSYIAMGTFPVFSGALTSILQRSGELLSASKALRDYNDITKAPASRKSGTISRKLSGPASLVLKNVTSGWAPEAPPVIRNVSLTVAPSELLAFWGRNGSGKTTLFNTIEGSLVPNRGKVILDGQPTDSLTDETFFAEVAHVNQQPMLFGSLTLRENLQWGVKNGDPVLFDEICKQLEVNEILGQKAWRNGKLESLYPDGLDTKLGKVFPKGVEPSTGQEQLFAIVRALYRRPRLLLVDEPTSALDSHNAANFTKVLCNLTPLLGYQPTICMITHDPLRLVIANRIAVLSRDCEGLAEVGTYEELMAKNGLFAASMVEAQIEKEKLAKLKSERLLVSGEAGKINLL